MARLRSPVSRSDSKTASSTSSGWPTKRAKPSMTRAWRAATVGPSISPVATIAPEFTIGLNGRFDASSTTIALNGLPDGSTPIRARSASRPRSSSASPRTNGFEIDWIVNGSAESPTS